MKMRMPLILAASIPLCACASQAPYVSPLADVSPVYRNSALTGAPAPAVPIRNDWWREFSDPVLDGLVALALEGNLSIEAAQGRLQQAAAASRSARSALLPSAAYSGSVALQRQSLEDPIGQFASRFPAFSRTVELFGLNSAATWEIDLFGRLAAGRRVALADAAAAAAEVAGARLTVTAELAAAYVTARELQARTHVARERVRTLSDLARLVRLRFREGAAARLEVDQVEADLASVSATLPALEASLDAIHDRIDILAGRAPGKAGKDLGVGPVPAAIAVDVRDGPAALLHRRPDIVAAERRVAAADARVSQAMADYYPRLTIGGLFGALSTSLGTLFTGDALQGAGTAGLSGRLFDFGTARARVEGARGRTREAVADYRATVLRATAEVENGLSLVVRRSAQARDLGASELALARARDKSRTAYEGGAISLIEALDAERRLLTAQDSVIAARAEAARATIMLFRALGGGWDLAPSVDKRGPAAGATSNRSREA